MKRKTSESGNEQRFTSHGLCDGGLSQQPAYFYTVSSLSKSSFRAATLGITQGFTSYNNPKGNTDTERLMRTLKEELLWLRERTSPLELEQSLSAS